LEWGIVGEREGRMGREREGGGQFTSNLGPEWTGIAPHTKEEFKVSERDLGTREGCQAKGELSRGIIKGTHQEGCAMCSDIVNLVYTYCAIVCMWLIKELCLGYKKTMCARSKIHVFNFMDPPEW
jgi:hypothetical protein